MSLLIRASFKLLMLWTVQEVGMLWHKDKEKIFALAGDVGALSGGLGGAPRLQPLRVGKERICC